MKKGICSTLLVLFFLAACQLSPALQEHTSTIIQNETPTITSINTLISSPTIKPSPTLTLTPTPIFPPLEEFLGTWKNIDRNTRDITKIVIKAKNNKIYVRPWGSCTPTDCDWGVASKIYRGDPVSLSWDHGEIIHNLVLLLEDDQLIVTCMTDFDDERENQLFRSVFEKTDDQMSEEEISQIATSFAFVPITPTPKPHKIEIQVDDSRTLIFNDILPVDGVDITEYSEIDFKDFVSGYLLKQEKYFIAKINIFDNDVVPVTDLYSEEYAIRSLFKSFSISVNNLNFVNKEDHVFFPESRPIKIISYYRFYDPVIFEENGLDAVIGIDKEDERYHKQKDYILNQLKKTPFWIISWCYANPDGKIYIGHSLIDRQHYLSINKTFKEYHPQRDFKFVPAYKHTKITFFENPIDNFYDGYTFLEILYRNHPEIQPDEKQVKQWISTGQMPEFLENSLFTFQTHLIYY